MNACQAGDQPDNDLARLSERSRDELIELWSINYGQMPPKGISRRLLERAAAYELQAAKYGGLKPQVRRRLLSATAREKCSPTTASSRNLSTGTRLVREWNGRSHTVDVIDGGFEWNGVSYRSLSAIALAITGTKWSGPRFFGL